jgi:hypothetical protein
VTSQNCEFTGRVAEVDDYSPGPCQLAVLRWHWGSAYVIDSRDGTWTARFHDDTTVLSAESANDLRTLIWDDYSNRKCSAAGPGERALRRLREDGVI